VTKWPTRAVGFDGLLLAGGQSRRFGTDKRVAPFRGLPLVVHGARTLRMAVTRGTVFVATGAARTSLPGTQGMVVVRDEPPHRGPLGGLAAALALTASGLIVLACDTPLVRHSTLSRLAALGTRTGRPAAIRTARGWEPLIAYYPKWVFNHVRAALDQGVLAPHLLLDRLPTVAVRIGSAAELANVNRPQDLAALAERS